MKKCMFAVVVALVLTSLSVGSVNQNLGTTTNLFAGTTGYASSGSQLMVDKAQYNKSGLWTANQGLGVMVTGNANSGRKGTAMVAVETGNLLSNNICNLGNINMNAISDTSVVTAATKNGTASGCVAGFTNQSSVTPKAVASDTTAVMVMSLASVMPIGCGGAIGTAQNCVNVGTSETSMTSGCPQNLCPAPRPNPCGNPCN
jgi:hypothetical protein